MTGRNGFARAILSADPYVVARRPRAILCLPLLHRCDVTGVFYLENELARNVFTATRIELLQLISSHAAIAVQNAMFYTSMQEASALLREANDRLEQQVADRTEALREANEHLQTRSEELHALNERLRHELSEHERAEAARTALQEEVIRMQRAQLAEMSTPLIPITDRVMAMPLVGTMEALRAAQVLETVLAGAQQRGAQVVILDVTGMRRVDNEVASSLIKTANGLRLLGAQAVLTGIRPDVAQMLVGMDVDLSGIVVRGTLQSGIAYAVGRGDAAPGARRGNA
ncbi:STAS domain-containing protein [Sorangium sp. So ce1128]